MKFNIKIYKRNIEDEEIINDLKRVACELNKNSVTRDEYNARGKYSSSTIEKRLGGWTSALNKANLKKNLARNISNENLLKNLAEVWIKLGKQPSYNDFIPKISKYSIKPYERAFGSWNNALLEFQKFINSKNKFKEYKKMDNKSVASKKRTSRSINYRLRFQVMQKDNFKCQACGRSPATDNSVILHIDHIKPWVNGGETILNNLQTLCSKCNLGKSDFT